MRYEIAKDVFPQAIENVQKMLRYGQKLQGCKTMQQGAAQLAVSYADALIEELEKGGKESEDERIRKNCIHFLELQKTHHAATFEIEECIAWLEKQGL